jgi:hypothetical protein
MGKQTVFTPPILNCICGEPARVYDWNYRFEYAVMCDKCFAIKIPECSTYHRAVCRWNTKIKKLQNKD